MKQSVALACLALCGLMLHSTSGLYIPDVFDDAASALAEDDIVLKKYVGTLPSDRVVGSDEMMAALADARRQHGVVKGINAPNGELALLKKVLIQAFQELIQEMNNALGITQDSKRSAMLI